MSPNYYEQVYAVVRRIPRGKVTNYGRIARMLGRNRAARAVGYALNALKDRHDEPEYADIPWQRVVNAKGQISIVNREFSANLQADMLRDEGVPVSDELRIANFDSYLWEGLPLGELDAIISGKSSSNGG
jgi:methylated-DNA-protein-cysteine methyltransferase-like protein